MEYFSNYNPLMIIKMKKKYLILILILVLSASCKSQMNSFQKTIKPKNNYITQDKADISLAKNTFKRDYKKTNYAKFEGDIITKDSIFQYEEYSNIDYKTFPIIKFGDKQIIEYFDRTIDYLLIFEKGLLYPEILGLESMEVGNIKELKYLSKSPKVKRFSFYIFCPNSISCAQMYFFELVNEKANIQTDWNSFLDNAKLTFVKGGWVRI